MSKTVVYQVKTGAKRLTNARIAALPPPLILKFRRILETLDEERAPLQLCLPGAGKW